MAVTDLNPVKTGTIKNVIDYDMNPLKTKDKLYVSGINCIPDIAYDEMMIVKNGYGKTDRIIGFHGYQSFETGEVSPDIAHEIGVKLAQELWGDRFQVIVSTHINTDNIHNHFCLNSVSFKDGKKYYWNKAEKFNMRKASDILCSDYGLSVLNERNSNRTNAFADKYANSNKTLIEIKQDIDYAIYMSNNYNDFRMYMKNMGYKLIDYGVKFSISCEFLKRNIRPERRFGKDYSLERIRQRIREEKGILYNSSYLKSGVNKHFVSKVYKDYKYKNKREPSLFEILFEFIIFVTMGIDLTKKGNFKAIKHKLSKEQKKAVKIMEKYSDENKMIAQYKIISFEDLESIKETKQAELSKLKSEREELQRENRKNIPEEKKNENINLIEKLSVDIKEVGRLVYLCNDMLFVRNKIKVERELYLIQKDKIEKQNKEKNRKYER